MNTINLSLSSRSSPTVSMPTMTPSIPPPAATTISTVPPPPTSGIPATLLPPLSSASTSTVTARPPLPTTTVTKMEYGYTGDDFLHRDLFSTQNDNNNKDVFNTSNTTTTTSTTGINSDNSSIGITQYLNNTTTMDTNNFNSINNITMNNTTINFNNSNYNTFNGLSTISMTNHINNSNSSTILDELSTPQPTTTTRMRTTTTADHHINDVIFSTKTLTNYTNTSTTQLNDHYINTTNNAWTNTNYIDSLNSTTFESIPSTLMSSSTTEHTTNSNFFDNYSNYFDNWRDNSSFSLNESSVLHMNDSIWFTSLQNDGSNPFINGNMRIDSSPETITKVFILALVSIFGSIGNFLVVGSVIKNRHLHRPPFYFVLSMGVTDLARAGFCLPVVMATSLQGSIWRHGDTACNMFAFAASFFVFSSALSLLVISIERHLSIVHAKAYRRRCHGLVNLFATLFIWGAAFLVSFPPIFSSLGAGEYVFISEEAQCTYAHKHFSHNDGINYVLTFLGIISLTLFLYYRIFVFMRSHRRMRPLQHRPAFSSTWTFVGPGANGQAFINWLNGFGGQASNVYQRAATAPPAETTATTTNSTLVADSNRSSEEPHSRYTTQRMNFGRVMNLCSTKNEHLTRLFLIMSLVHGATWLPYIILSLWRVFLNSSNIPAGFITYAAWLSYAQVALCPLAYFVSRGRSRNSSRIIQMEPTERNEFLLENKIFK